MLLFEAEAQQQTAEVHDRILTTVMIIRVQTSPLRVWTHVSELSEGPPVASKRQERADRRKFASRRAHFVEPRDAVAATQSILRLTLLPSTVPCLAPELGRPYRTGET